MSSGWRAQAGPTFCAAALVLHYQSEHHELSYTGRRMVLIAKAGVCPALSCCALATSALGLKQRRKTHSSCGIIWALPQAAALSKRSRGSRLRWWWTFTIPWSHHWDLKARSAFRLDWIKRAAFGVCRNRYNLCIVLRTLQILSTVLRAVCLLLPFPLLASPSPPLFLRKEIWIFWWEKYLETISLAYSKGSDNRRQI